MRKPRMGLRSRMAIQIGGVLLLSFAVLIYFVSLRAGETAERSAERFADALAERYAAEVAAELETAMNAARNTAHFFAGLKNGGIPVERTALIQGMRGVLAGAPGLFGIWTVWEPDALDGRDAEFVHAPGHDATGRFVPYWNRQGGIHLEPCVDYDASGLQGDYYRRPMATGNELLLEPVTYEIGGESVTVVSAIAPVETEAGRAGVVGVDFSMDRMAKIAAGIRPLDAGFGLIAAPNHIAVAGPEPSWNGEPVAAILGLSEATREAVHVGEEVRHRIRLEGREFLAVSTPVRAGGSEDLWRLWVALPAREAMAEARSLRDRMFGIVLAAPEKRNARTWPSREERTGEYAARIPAA